MSVVLKMLIQSSLLDSTHCHPPAPVRLYISVALITQECNVFYHQYVYSILLLYFTALIYIFSLFLL